MNIAPKTDLSEDALSEMIAVLGRTGSGKTYTAKGIVEKLLDEGRRVCVIDPTSAWWGLRLSADGKSKGFPVVIFGGPHADVPINEHAGEAVGKLVGSSDLQCVIDLRDMLVGEQCRFMERFLEAVYQANSTPLHLVVDEADEFGPQKPQPERARMLGQFDRVARRGRSRGIRLLAITQRPAKLNKDILGMAGTLIAMQLTLPHDRDAVKAWIGEQADPAVGKSVLQSLPALKRGEGWAWRPVDDLLRQVKFPPIRTFDSSSTPKDGAARPATVQAIGEGDLAKIRTAMTAAIDEARANDPKALKLRVAELEQQLAGTIAGRNEFGETASEELDRTANRAMELLSERNKLFDDTVRFSSEIHQHNAERKNLSEQLIRLAYQVAGTANTTLLQQSVTHTEAPSQHGAVESSPLPKLSTENGSPARGRVEDRGPHHHRDGGGGNRAAAPAANGDLPKGERAILTAIAQHVECSKEQLSILCGYKRSARDTYLQRLRAKGYIADEGGPIRATREGVAALGSFERLPTGARLLAHWMGRLPRGEAAVLKVVCEHWPKPTPRTAIDEATCYKRSARDTYIQRLQARRLVQPTHGGVKASDMLFDRRSA